MDVSNPRMFYVLCVALYVLCLDSSVHHSPQILTIRFRPTAPLDFGEVAEASGADQEMAAASNDQFVEATNCEYCQTPWRAQALFSSRTDFMTRHVVKSHVSSTLLMERRVLARILQAEIGANSA